MLAGLAAIGYMQWRERSAVDSSRQERQALAQADRAVASFATVMRRLPCPDVDRDGQEDCGSGEQKGWLPSLTLRLAGADPGVDVGQLRYLVQRGGGANDLTKLDDSWRPLEYDATGKTFASMRTTTDAGGTYPAGILTLTDLCQRLDEGRRATYGAGMAEVRSAPIRLVAYALIHPGNADADGDGSVFDGINASADSAVEDPARRPLLARYDDLVEERSYTSLLASLHCAPLIDSINTVSLAHDVVVQVDELRSGNIESAKRAIAFAAAGAAITTIDTTLTVLGVVMTTVKAAYESALCAATLGILVNACAAAPIHTTAAVLTAGVIVANLASAAANIAAAVMAGEALALADSSVDASKLTCPAMDFSQALAAANQALTDAEADLAALRTQIVNKQNELNAALNARTAAVDNLYAQVRAGGISSDIDSLVAPVLNAAVGWEGYSFAVQEATGRRDSYRTAVDEWTKQIAVYAYKIANRTSLIASLTAEIAALDVQIAATTDPTAKAALQRTRLEKTSELTLLNDPVELQKQYDKAVGERATAQSNLDLAEADLRLAQTNLSASQTTFQTAYNSLLNAGRYRVAFSSPPPSRNACTSTAGACRPGDINTTAGIYAALVDLFGASSSAPDPDAKYLKPIKLKKELDALQARVSDAEARVTRARTTLKDLQDRVNTPPSCNITGKGVTPMPPATALDILVNVDRKGGTR
ncbi:MAG TPA: hypothetical protein VM407_15995 [Acidovorax sp.]|nr:hypothetical protein [Acidovorax sp.]